jgi:hypothetical protein
MDQNADIIYTKIDNMRIGETANFGKKKVYRKSQEIWIYKGVEYTDLYTLADMIF